LVEKEKILDKLGKIKAHMESAKEIGNEQEAEAFAGMLQQLLLKHKLEMTDIDYNREMQDEPIIQHTPETVIVSREQKKRYYSVTELSKISWDELPSSVRRFLVDEGYSFSTVEEWKQAYNAATEEERYNLLHTDNGVGSEFPSHKWYRGSETTRKRVYKDYPDVEVLNQRRAWVEELAAIVASAYSCRILVSKGSSIIHFVGHKSNIAIAEYLFVTMMRIAERLSDQAAKKMRREWRAAHGVGNTPPGFRESFLDGFTNRIAQRLAEARRAFEGPTTSVALVRVNKEALAVRNYMEENFHRCKRCDHLEGQHPHGGECQAEGCSCKEYRGRSASSLGGSKNFNADGYREGKRVADSMDIHGNAIKSGQANKQLG
jgi:hypothetical protein